MATETPSTPLELAQRLPSRVSADKDGRHQAVPLAHHNAVQLRRASFLCVWGCIVGLHCVCALFLTQCARVCYFFKYPFMEYWQQMVAGDRDMDFVSAGLALDLLGALHWWQLLCILWASLRARELVFLDSAFKLPFPFRSARHFDGQLNRYKGREFNCVMSSAILVAQFFVQTWQFFFSRRGVFGVESNLFPAVFTIREAVEIVSQSFQARRSSELLPRLWLNNLLVALVVANCWSTPIVQHVFYRRQQREQSLDLQNAERAVSLVLTAVLNIGSSILVPLVVFLPYYEVFIPEALTFPRELLYDSLWFVRLAMEGQLLFSLDTADFFSRIVPHIGIFSSLASAATLIQRHQGSRLRRSKVLATHGGPAGNETKGNGLTSPQSPAISVTTHSLHHAVHVLFFAWGLGLVTLHLRAVMRPHEPVQGCIRSTSPWSTRGYPCSTYVYNCYREGTTSPNEDSWARVDEETLLFLTIAHCPELRVPRRLQDFPNLVGVHLHNTTLVEWDRQSTISAAIHTKLLVVIIGRTNLTGIPDGLLGPLPASLVDITFTYTNLTSLPPDLHDKWHPLVTLKFEHSLIAEFPKTLLSMEALLLSLHGNRIEEIPELADMHRYLFTFTMSANPLRALPETIGDGTSFINFGAENTLLETLPGWTQTNILGPTYLYGTPYCTSPVGAQSNTMVCATRDYSEGGRTPVELMDARLPL